MQILNSTIEDVDEIFRLYRLASDFQKKKSVVYWREFERNLVENEIADNRQWKILIGGKIACVWVTTFSDPLIWGELDNDAALYLHRVATSPDFRGNKMFLKVVAWAKWHAAENQKQFIRMDTVGENRKLIEYYQDCGFDFKGLSKLNNTDGLPTHYQNATACLFELKIY